MELGVYSFGDTPWDTVSNSLGSSSQATRNLLEAIRLADQVGLDYFGVGEHHTHEAPVSAGAIILAAAAAVTRKITLGSSVTVLSTEDPVRVYQQFATLDAISGGRAEITAGRGSSRESFPLFGYSLADYDGLYAEKLELLLQINAFERVTWKGKYRPPLADALIVPRPDKGPLKIWLGTGGNPESSVRAGQLGLPIAYGIIGGPPARFAPLANLYRDSASRSGVLASRVQVSIGLMGLVHEDGQTARNMAFHHLNRARVAYSKAWGVSIPQISPAEFEQEARPGGAYFVGNPEEVAARVVELHRSVGHMRQFFQMDLGNLPQADYLRSIELMGTRVKPLVDAELGSAI